MAGRSRRTLLIGITAASTITLLAMAQWSRHSIVLTARSSSVSQPQTNQINQLCIGNSSESVCLENGWNYGSVSGAWDEAEGVIASFSAGDVALINHLYQEMLGRDADPEGLETYVEALERGWSVDKIRGEIANSHETRQILSQLYLIQLLYSYGFSISNSTRKTWHGGFLGNFQSKIAPRPLGYRMANLRRLKFSM